MLTVDYVEFGLMRTLLVVVDSIILGSLIYFLQIEIHSVCVVYVCVYTCMYWIASKGYRPQSAAYKTTGYKPTDPI